MPTCIHSKPALAARHACLVHGGRASSWSFLCQAMQSSGRFSPECAKTLMHLNSSPVETERCTHQSWDLTCWVWCACSRGTCNTVTEAHVSLLLHAGLLMRDMQDADLYLFSMAGAGPVVKSLLKQRKARCAPFLASPCICLLALLCVHAPGAHIIRLLVFQQSQLAQAQSGHHKSSAPSLCRSLSRA